MKSPLTLTIDVETYNAACIALQRRAIECHGLDEKNGDEYFKKEGVCARKALDDLQYAKIASERRS